MTGMSRFTSYGICALCGKRTTKAAMTRHLGSCLAEHEPSRGKAARLLRLRVEDAFSPIFWMDVEMKAGATLEELDDFLRGEWLECCGHLSNFDIDGISYTVTSCYGKGPLSGFADPIDRTMKVKLGPISAKFQGEAKIENLSEADRTGTISAKGADRQGGSRATAKVRYTLAESGANTQVDIAADIATDAGAIDRIAARQYGGREGDHHRASSQLGHGPVQVVGYVGTVARTAIGPSHSTPLSPPTPPRRGAACATRALRAPDPPAAPRPT
jgi:hypothetical protein